MVFDISQFESDLYSPRGDDAPGDSGRGIRYSLALLMVKAR